MEQVIDAKEMTDMRDKLKEFLVKFFIMITRNIVKGVETEDEKNAYLQTSAKLKQHYGDDLIIKLCKEVASVASDSLQAAAQCLWPPTDKPVDHTEHKAIWANIENLLKMYVG